MIFLHAKQPNMIIYHVAVAVAPLSDRRWPFTSLS